MMLGQGHRTRLPGTELLCPPGTLYLAREQQILLHRHRRSKDSATSPLCWQKVMGAPLPSYSSEQEGAPRPEAKAALRNRSRLGRTSVRSEDRQYQSTSGNPHPAPFVSHVWTKLGWPLCPNPIPPARPVKSEAQIQSGTAGRGTDSGILLQLSRAFSSFLTPTLAFSPGHPRVPTTASRSPGPTGSRVQTRGYRTRCTLFSLPEYCTKGIKILFTLRLERPEGESSL